jgi:hypothetical protein
MKLISFNIYIMADRTLKLIIGKKISTKLLDRGDFLASSMEKDCMKIRDAFLKDG